MTCKSIFGASAKYVKPSGGEFIAVDGVNIIERLSLSSLRMPYQQLLKSRIILRPGQSNYLLNHLGLGDSSTLLIVKVSYDSRSVIEADNYLLWSFADDIGTTNPIAQLLVLTGNSAYRNKQVYISNPNIKYPVTLDVMVGVIDDTYAFFNDTPGQIGTTFVGLRYTDIRTHVAGESIVIYDNSLLPLIFITLNSINLMSISGNLLIIEDSSIGSIFLQFLTEYDALQAHSLLNYILENPGTNIATISPLNDDLTPIIYFNSRVGGTGNYISLNGATAGVPYNTSDGITFSTTMSIATYGTSGIIDKSTLRNLLIASASDNRDGVMTVSDIHIILDGPSGLVNSIVSTGTYSFTFNFSDIAGNFITNKIVILDITT